VQDANWFPSTKKTPPELQQATSSTQLSATSSTKNPNHQEEISVLVGNWLVKQDGIDDEIAFEIDEQGNKRFRSWLHQRPSMSDCSWNLDDEGLRIVCPSEGWSELFQRIEISPTRLTFYNSAGEGGVYIKIPDTELDKFTR
jgi:hypothetical protein